MTAKLRRTKIVITLGPATDKKGMLEKLIRAGANVVRMNFSHGSAQEHINRAQEVRRIATKLGTHIAILGDLQGPKIRISTFSQNDVVLVVGQRFTLDTALDAGKGDSNKVGLDYKNLPQDVKPDDILLLDDGRIQLKVIVVEGSSVHTEVLIGGGLSNNKGINKKGGGLSACALTEKDQQDILIAAQISVDYLAISFPRNAQDMHLARKLANEAGLSSLLVAKIERAETVESDQSIDDIIIASDVVMVARGDLGVEIGDPELVGVQKKLIRRARSLNRGVITATQMMESMITSPMPTRAEVMDVANAVLDGTDAVMLSAETAVGRYPVETVTSMAEVCLGAEKMPSINVSNHRLNKEFKLIDEAVSMATMYAANHMPKVKAIVALTESGKTALMMSRISSGKPIFALSRHQSTLSRTCLYRGVTPIYFESNTGAGPEVAKRAITLLQEQGFLQPSDIVIFTQGDDSGYVGTTNTMRLITVT